MSKKDYVRIARAFRIWRPSEQTEQRLWLSIAEQVAAELQEDNPRFSRELFYKACDA